MANTVLIGVDLGPNLSVTGSLATILWLLAIRKDSGGDTDGEKLDVSFWKFLKVGAVAMPVALFAALGGAILMQTLVHGRDSSVWPTDRLRTSQMYLLRREFARRRSRAYFYSAPLESQMDLSGL